MAKSEGLPLWPVAAAAAVAVIGLVVALAWPDPPTSLQVDNPEHHSAGAAVGNVRAGTPYVFVGYPLCVAHGGVTITGVVPQDPEAIKVVDWAATAGGTRPTNVSGRPGKAKSLHGFTRTAISNPCSTSQQFAISVERTGAIGVAHGFEIRSTSGTVLMPYTVRLCASDCPGGISQSGTP